MSEKLYRIERRPAKAYEAYAYTPVHETYSPVDVIVPVDPVHDLAWAVSEMVYSPGVEYITGHGSRWRYNSERGAFEMWIEYRKAWAVDRFYGEDRTSREWSRYEVGGLDIKVMIADLKALVEAIEGKVVQ